MNRELSWLSFNERVLQEAQDHSVPLLERLKFLGIFSSNLDEFFRVRVGTLQRMVKAGIKAKTELGSTPKKILKEIHDVVVRQRVRFEQIFTDLYNELEKQEIFIINEKQLNESQQRFVQTYFRQEVRPRLAPMMLAAVPRFPYLKNQVIYLAVHLSRTAEELESEYALIEVPASVLPRFIVLPKSTDGHFIIILDDVIRFGLREIFAIFDYDLISAYTIKLTRDAELDIEDDITQSLLEKISKSVKKRTKGQAVRFVYDREIPEDLLHFLKMKNNLEHFDNLIAGGRYHNARDFMNFPKVGPKLIGYEKRPFVPHSKIDQCKSLFEAISERDLLLHYPYHSFQDMVDLLREAAIDPNVTSISITLYRVAEESNVINTLINAVRNGKSVNVLLELKARFDEEANIRWTQALEEEGAHLIEGVPGLKVHAKLCLITRREGNRLARYAMVGTGNFNEETAKIYSDHALFTANKQLTKEVQKVFAFLDDNYKTSVFKHLIVSPFNMRKRFIKLIN